MEKEEILKAIMKLPKLKANNPISTMFGISEDDLMRAIDRFNKVPTYNELLRENKNQKEIIDKAIEYVEKNVYKEDNGCGDYWWEIESKEKILSILEDKKV